MTLRIWSKSGELPNPEQFRRMRSSPLRGSGVSPMRSANSLSVIAPCFRCQFQRVEHRVECRMCVLRCLPVVWTAALTCVAPEQPAMQVDLLRGSCSMVWHEMQLVRVDDSRCDDGPRGTMFHAGAARSAVRPFKRGYRRRPHHRREATRPITRTSRIAV